MSCPVKRCRADVPEEGPARVDRLPLSDNKKAPIVWGFCRLSLVVWFRGRSPAGYSPGRVGLLGVGISPSLYSFKK